MWKHLKVPVIPIVVILVSIVRCRSCPEGWVQNDQRCYLPLTSPRRTWEDAIVACREVGGNIVLPSTVEENYWIWKLFREQNTSSADSSSYGGLWLGCFRPTDDNGAIVCWKPSALPKQMDHAAWEGGQPDGGRCVVLWRHNDVWSDVKCDVARFTMCERPLCQRLAGRCYEVKLDREDQGCSSMNEYIIEEKQMTSLMQCCAACSKNPYCWSFSMTNNKCVSYNVKRSDVMVDKSVADTSDVNCSYYEVDKD